MLVALSWITSYHLLSYSATSCHIMSRHYMSCDTMLWVTSLVRSTSTSRLQDLYDAIWYDAVRCCAAAVMQSWDWTCSTVLNYSALYCSNLISSALYWVEFSPVRSGTYRLGTTLYCFSLHCTSRVWAVYCTALYSIMLHCTVLYCTALYCCTSLYSVVWCTG